MKIIILIVLLASLIAGCSATGSIYKPVDTIDSEHALIYIYRPGTYTLSAHKAEFEFDGDAVGSLSNNGYMYIVTKPGKHKLTHQWSKEFWTEVEERKKVELEVVAERNRPAYIEIVADSWSTYDRMTNSEVRHQEWILRQVSAEKGQKKIKNCRLNN